MEQRSSSAVERPARVERLVGVPVSPRVFVVFALEDTWFVEGFLLQALGLPEDDVLLSSKLELGAPIIKALERGALCPVTVVVMSPAFLVSAWAQFAYELATHRSVEAAPDGSAAVVQVVVADCELPLLSRFRESLDFRRRVPGHWEAEVERLRRKLAAPAPEAVPVPCPYPGIRPFTTEEAAYFHGRDDEVRDLLGRLRDGRRELYVIGPSGSGKSSLVAAGLVPSLRASPARAGGSFLVVRMRPGADPIAALATALHATGPEPGDAVVWLGNAIDRLLASHPEHDRLLLFIDQLEELFTVAESPARAACIAAVRALRGDDRIALVLALRADFYASLMESSLWADLGGQLSRLDVSPLRGDKLRTAIEAPARRLGVYFEPILVERLLNDVADEPGALPLLQDTLLDLWHSRTRGLLRLAEYEAMSDGTQTGLAVTVARRADGALHDLLPARRAIARRVLLRLIQFGDGSAPTRRQQPRAALATTSDSADDIDLVVHHLADRRLITISGGDDAEPSARIDLAHEVLLSAWPTLDEWLHSRRHDEQRRRALEAKAAEWVGNGGGESRLLDAEELREAHSWLDDDQVRDLGVSDDVVRLLARSKAALDAQRTEADARRRRVRRWITSTFAVLVVAVVAVSALAVFAERRSQVADDQSREARRQAGVADQQSRQAHQQLARNLISQAQPLLLGGHPEQAIPYLVAARDAGADGVSVRMLFRWASRSVPIQQIVHGGPVRTVAWSPDGRRIATASGDWTARVWDAVDGHAVTKPLSHQGDVRAVAWSPDGKRVATASDDHTAQTWDAGTGRAIAPPLGHRRAVVAVAWSPDGQQLATASDDGTARVWNAASGQAVTQPLGHQAGVLAVAWSPDGQRVATASDDSTARVWNAASGQAMTPPLTHRGRVLAVAWSPDGRSVATASEDQTVRVWDATTGQPVQPPLSHQDAIWAVAWSPDGKRLSTASADNTARVWNALGEQPMTLAHQKAVWGVAWSPDGRRVATASADDTARVWDPVSGRAVTPPLAHQNGVLDVAWSPDGTRLATASWDHTARVWDPVSGQAVTPPLVHEDGVLDLAWSPDGTRLATASADGTARIWDPVAGRAVTPALTHKGKVRKIAWSPDGQRVATASADNTARVWNALTGQPVMTSITHGHNVWGMWGITAVAWSPDGRRLATASDDRTARVWDAVSGEAAAPALLHEGTAALEGNVIASVVWSPDGTRVATASSGHIARVWNATSGEATTPPLVHQDRVIAIAWSPDGTRVATASADHTARVWDAVTGQALTPPLAHQDVVWEVAWSPDGTRLVTVSDDHTARIWNVSWDTGTLADWRVAEARCDYRLAGDGVLVARGPRAPNLFAAAVARLLQFQH